MEFQTNHLPFTIFSKLQNFRNYFRNLHFYFKNTFELHMFLKFQKYFRMYSSIYRKYLLPSLMVVDEVNIRTFQKPSKTICEFYFYWIWHTTVCLGYHSTRTDLRGSERPNSERHPSLPNLEPSGSNSRRGILRLTLFQRLFEYIAGYETVLQKMLPNKAFKAYKTFSRLIGQFCSV